MSIVFTTNTSETFVGNTVDDELLSVNMRSHHNRTHEGSDFLQVMEQLNTNSIRFPGGTVTEEHFDITDPNATRVVNAIQLIHPEKIPARTNGVPVTRTVTPLSDYLDYVNSIDGDPTIVIPTYRFFDQLTRDVTENAEEDIRTFVRELFQDSYGDVEKVTLEIGNEYYQGRFNWTLEEFAAFQAKVAEWIDDEVSSLGLRDDLTLLAQSSHVRNNNPGRSAQDNAVLRDAFEDASIVDGVILHFYGTSGAGDPLQMGNFIGDVLDVTKQSWGTALGEDFEIAITEWNVGENGENDTVVNGIMRSAPLLYMFAEMVRNDVDKAMIWAARTDGPAGLSMRSEDGSELTPTGLFYEMLSESTKGLNLVDPGDAYQLRNAAGGHVGYTYTFQDQDRSVVYFASGVDETIDLTADLTGVIPEGALVYARTLGAVEGDNGTDYRDDAMITQQDDVEITVEGGQRLFEVELGAYELIELHIINRPGLTVYDDPNSNRPDILTGSDFDDIITANGGRDELRGKAGDDVLDGGLHRDILLGEDGNDVLNGGGGWDLLGGGRGADELFGGDGNDWMYGGNDDDVLWGEQGSDLMVGGNGDDLLIGDYGRDRLNGGAGDDELRAGPGWDRLNGGAGDDLMEGGRGNDVFIFNATDNGADRIVDFNHHQDQIDLTAFGFGSIQDVFNMIEFAADGILLNAADGNSMLLEGYNLANIDEDQFIL